MAPAAIWVMVTPDSAPLVSTGTGTGELSVPAVAELPLGVLPPAVDRPGGGQRAGVVGAAATWVIVTPDSAPLVSTGTGTGARAVRPLPSRPLPPAPQQYTPPADDTAHVWLRPALMSTRVTPPVCTGTGLVRDTVAPSPSRPLPPFPQQ